MTVQEVKKSLCELVLGSGLINDLVFLATLQQMAGEEPGNLMNLIDSMPGAEAILKYPDRDEIILNMLKKDDLEGAVQWIVDKVNESEAADFVFNSEVGSDQEYGGICFSEESMRIGGEIKENFFRIDGE